MDVTSLLPPEVANAAKAIGLIGADGSVSSSWFSDPLSGLQGVLTTATQRAAFLSLLDKVVPAEPVPGVADGAQWHPLLGPQPDGNVYLTVNDASSSVIFGVGGLFQPSSSPPSAAAGFSLPLISVSGTDVIPVAGTASGPLDLWLRVQLGWTVPAHSIALAAVSLAVRFAPAAGGGPTDSISVTLEGLDFDGSGPRDVALNPDQLGSQATQLIVGLMKQELAQIAGSATGDAAALATHLPPLLGLDGTLPPFPLAGVASDPLALQRWMNSLLNGVPPPVIQWLSHLAGLMGIIVAPVAGSGTASDPWTVTLAALTGSSAAAVTLARGTASDGVSPVLLAGFTLGLVPASASPPARIDAAATLLAVPLSGTAPAVVLPAAMVVVRSPGDPAGQLAPPTAGGAFSAGALRAGIRWDGTGIAPLLELLDVTLEDASYERIDLTNTGSVAAAAAAAVIAAIKAAIGATGAGAHLAALAGLIPPGADPSAPLVDPAQLVTNPTRAIAAIHRQALVDAAHPWSNLFAELTALVGLAGPVSGTGTLADPWRAAIATAGPLSVELAAWNAQVSGNAADPQQLRLGLRVSGSGNGVDGWWCSELLGFDLPATGAGTVSLLGSHHALLELTPGGPGATAGVSVGADSLTVTLDAQTGTPPVFQAAITNLALGSTAGTVNIAKLTFPPAGSFDVTDPQASLGITAAQLEAITEALLTAQLTDSLGVTGLALSVLSGCNPGAPGLQADFPSLGDPAGPGSLFTEPVQGLQAWLSRVATGSSADGSGFAAALAAWAQALLAGNLPADIFSAPDASQLAGSGTYEDPWQLPLGQPGSAAVGLAWLEPAGPPSTTALIADAIDASYDAPSLIAALAGAGPYLPAFPAGFQTATAITGLQSLAAYLTSTDGVVPAASQIPAGAGWTTGTPISTAHPMQPQDLSAVSQILAQIGSWAADGPYAVLLLGPAFSDHATWSQLLAKAGTDDSSTYFDLRLPGVSPASIDLRTVTAAANYYTADLQDDGTGNTAGLSAQIGLLVNRVGQLRPGIPVVLVAHSTAGIPALSYATANPANVRGLITLGTPFAGSPLTPLLDLPTADIIRLYRHLLPAGIAAGPARDALEHLLAALDGYLPPPAGALPVPWPYPVGSFSGAASTSTSGIPALALGGALGADLIGQLRTAASAAVRAFTAAPPTHLSAGVQVTCPAGPDVNVASAVTIRLDAGRMPLQAGAAEPDRPSHAITFEAALSRPNGWLVGGPVNYAGASAPPITTRVRAAELGLQLALNSSGQLQATPVVNLHEAAFRGPTADLAGWAQPAPTVQVEQLLGAIFQTIAAPPPPAGTSLAAVLAALQAFGIATADPAGDVSVSADALTAISADPLGFLGSKASAALASPGGLAGLTPAAGGSYLISLPGIPLELFIEPAPWTIGLRTTQAGTGITLGSGANLSFSVALPVAALTPIWALSVTGAGTSLGYSTASGLALQLPAAPPLQLLPPPGAAALSAALDSSLPRLLISAAASALIDTLLPPGYQATGLVSFLTNPGGWLVSQAALGDGNVVDPAKITQLLDLIPLPAALTVTATGSSPTTIAVATTAPVNGVLSIDLGASIDSARHLTPAGSITLQLALPGTWPTLGISVGAGASGVTLTLTPGGAAPIQLLPTFSGLGSLAGAAEALLPAALDAYVEAAGPTPATRGQLMQLALNTAAALGLYDEAGRFSAHTAELNAMLDSGWSSTVAAAARSAFVTAAAAVFNDPASPLSAALPGTITAAGTTLTWTAALPAGLGSGTLSIGAGWDTSGPTFAIGATGLALTDGPLIVSLGAGYATGALAVTGSAGLRLATNLGIDVIPQLVLNASPAGRSASFLPLGPGTDTVLAVHLFPPAPVTAASGAGAQLTQAWVIPMAASLLINATSASFGSKLWPSGPTIEKLLTSAGLITADPGAAPGSYSLATPIPPVLSILHGLLSALASPEIAIPSTDLCLQFVSDATGLGARLTGDIDLPAGDTQISVLFGGTTGWTGTNPPAGVTLYLLTAGGSPVFTPVLHAAGVGVSLHGAGDAPLLNQDGFRLGGVDGYLFFDLGAGIPASFGAGADLDQLGLPLSQLDASSASNPVAASLFDDSPGAGDSSPVNPGADITVYYPSGGPLQVQFHGNPQIVLPVHASFGPVYIDQIELSFNSSGGYSAELGIDGSVTINGLDVSVQELGLQIPLKYLLSPDQWSLDLAGLAVSFTEGPVQIAGGLRKNTGPPVEYDGMLSVSVPDFGFTIVGAYSRPKDSQGDTYTSVFMFVSLPIVLGGPPFAIIIGLGGGFGYNRELKPPSDLNNIDSYPLVAALDDDSLANDPMGALMRMSASIPPRRGSFWLGAGLRFTTFVLINTDAVLYVALDRGFDIALIGVSRMAMPTEDLAIASVELAILVRYSSAEGLLSAQAQLTDNSYLFSHDCQLTGGFAWFMWFPQAQFVLTLGGYHPAFAKPPQFPDVPRLGFNWSVLGIVTIKGGAYFALTNSCVMAGGSLEASATIGPVSAWFTAYLDILICWDPFSYSFDVGVEIGISVSMQVCFFGCVTIGLTLSKGASLSICGPPFHGSVTVDAYVTTITIPFGDNPVSATYIQDWDVFAGTYLTAGDPDGAAINMRMSKGVLPPDPPGAQPQPGTQAQPWQLATEFTLVTETRMPAATAALTNFGMTPAAPGFPVNQIDLAAMDVLAVASEHKVTICALDSGGPQPAKLSNDNITVGISQGLFPEATWHWTDPNQLRAAARTISAVTGTTIDAHVGYCDPTDLIPIGQLVEDRPQAALPLPFPGSTIISIAQYYGNTADQLASGVAAAATSMTLTGAAELLTGTGTFTALRTAAGLPPAGLPPIAASTLLHGRSAPPLLTPITTGLSMKPVSLPAPAKITTIPVVTAVPLTAPRLKAVLQTRPQPVTDAAPAVRTSVSPKAARDAPRMTPPTPPAIAGARLILVPAANAPRPTRAALDGQATRNADLGAATGPAQQALLARAAADLLGAGVTIGAGAAHLWEIPDSSGTITLSGNGIARVICADRSGRILTDTETTATNTLRHQLAPGTEALLVLCLGTLPDGVAAPPTGFAAVSAAAAPPGQPAAVGWQSTSTLLQLGPTRLIGRGSTITLTQPHTTRRSGQRASIGLATAADALTGQPGSETRLPASITVVMICLDRSGAGASSGDLAVGAQGATLLTPPVRVTGGQHRILLYDLEPAEPAGASVTISVASLAGWQVTGVVGLRGRAAEWAAAMHGGIPEHFVPDGPIRPSGSVTVTYTRGAAR